MTTKTADPNAWPEPQLNYYQSQADEALITFAHQRQADIDYGGNLDKLYLHHDRSELAATVTFRTELLEVIRTYGADAANVACQIQTFIEELPWFEDDEKQDAVLALTKLKEAHAAIGELLGEDAHMEAMQEDNEPSPDIRAADDGPDTNKIVKDSLRNTKGDAPSQDAIRNTAFEQDANAMDDDVRRRAIENREDVARAHDRSVDSSGGSSNADDGDDFIGKVLKYVSSPAEAPYLDGDSRHVFIGSTQWFFREMTRACTGNHTLDIDQARLAQSARFQMPRLLPLIIGKVRTLPSLYSLIQAINSGVRDLKPPEVPREPFEEDDE